ncbi:MAG TPA: Hpt domain-containing protein [Candidatus Rifleibacterium sp.]|nr:Hpt domain-containing protein [Candidatus Rifleibacterium sp.]
MANDLKSVFRESAGEFLLELEQALLHLNKNPDDMTEIARMFRVMHTIKGSAAMVDLNDVAHFAHTLESECDYLRQGQAKVTPEIIHLALCAHDCLSSLIESHYGGEVVDPEQVENILQNFATARKQATVKSSSDAYGYEKTLKLIKATIKDLTGHSGSDPEKVIAAAGQKMTQLYYLLTIQNKESAAEFISKLETVFRNARIAQSALPEELIDLAVEMMREVEEMYDDSGELSEADFDPDKILQSMERPMRLNNRLNEITDKMRLRNAALPSLPASYRIKIFAEERGPGSMNGSVRFEKVFNRIGVVMPIKQKNSESETPR